MQGTDRSKNGNATKEDVFAIQVTPQDGTNSLNTFFADPGFGGRGDIFIDPPHFALYEDGDERALLFFDDTYTAKFNNQFGNIPIVRLAEMYLTRAECNYRLSSAVGATPLADVNTIRQRANLPPLGSITFVGEILRERRLELAFEGHLLHDLKRTQSNVGFLYFDNPSLIFPIPQREILINPDLVQNEAYVQN
ncbi:MAG: RagB/SusD family nutrient uptake outer membrane protein [Cyclobacteriaceae bacterium]|nr:RagB/SusD family nutrient uptake outer membrane protein [Cyclobacteriaceae bacterium]